MSKDIEDALRRHRSFEQFQEFEQLQRLQEDLRKQFNSPLGRDPPLQLPRAEPAWKSCRQLLSPQSSVRQGHARGREARFLFTKDCWEVAKATLKVELSRPVRLQPLPREVSRSLPSIPGRVSDSFQYARPASRDLASFNPFLRPYAHNHFFPITFFFMDETDYAQWVFPLEAWSRWRETDERWDWRPCLVLEYAQKDRLFTIQWRDTQVKKRVSRVNLRFEMESEEDFLLKLTEATQRRDLQEAILRCETRVTAILPQFPQIRLSPDTETRISASLRRYLAPGAEYTVLQEVNDYYRRSVVNFIFEIEHFFPKWQLTLQ